MDPFAQPGSTFGSPPNGQPKGDPFGPPPNGRPRGDPFTTPSPTGSTAGQNPSTTFQLNPDWIRYYFNTTPGAALSNITNGNGTNNGALDHWFQGGSYGPSGGAYGNFLNAHLNQFYNNYQAASMQPGNANLDFTDYLNRQAQPLQNQFQYEHAQQNGYRPPAPRRIL